MGRVSFYTLGCKLNFAETSNLKHQFEAHGYTCVGEKEPCDIFVINTCSVTSEADRKCRQMIRRAHRRNPDAFIIVTGCYAQLQPDKVAAIKGVNAVLGNSEKAHLFDLIDEFISSSPTQINVSCTGSPLSFDPALLADDRTRAFLKVQDGCDYTCSFCTIPIARGKSRSAPIEKVADQARLLADHGIKEIVLTGVNIGLYGQGSLDTNSDHCLLDLLKRLSEIDGIQRYRISSIEPNLLTNDIIDFVAATPAIVPHFHIPLQSGDNVVLGAMRRRYRKELYLQRLEYIHSRIPDAGIGADVIVGFPAETPQHFSETHKFLANLPVAYLHVFTYSERPNTVAANHSQSYSGVSPQERTERNHSLQQLSKRKQIAFQERFRGHTRSVLWEQKTKSGRMQGYTDNYIRVSKPFDVNCVGAVQEVQLGTDDVRFVTS